MSIKQYHVYILASKSRTLYIGMTGYLMARVLRHRAGEGGKFSSKYRVFRLIYCETFSSAENAIRRETEIKKWRRQKKIALIQKKNPAWEDLAAGCGESVEMMLRPVNLS